jgi:methyltransferase (TIGR00027 family)
VETKQSSMTALISAFARAYHAENDAPKIFDDSVARRLMTDEEHERIAGYMMGGLDFFAPEKKSELSDPQEALRWVVQTQLAPTPLARARYSEDMLLNAIRTGTRQYVILGAGMDTFAYRYPELSNSVQVFEVDHPATQAFKRQRVEMASLDTPPNLHYVPLDFTAGSLADGLMEAGFDCQALTFFSWLGVTYYLTKEENLATLESIANLAPRGSSVVFDYAGDGLFASKTKRVQNMVAMAQGAGEPMKSCYDYRELESALETTGMIVYEHLSTSDIEGRFFRGRNDYLHAFEHIAYALAVVQ